MADVALKHYKRPHLGRFLSLLILPVTVGHSNVYVIDCRASAYGDGGVTQEYRYQHEARR